MILTFDINAVIYTFLVSVHMVYIFEVDNHLWQKNKKKKIKECL